MRCRPSSDDAEGGRFTPAALTGETGMVTAELAIALLSLVLLVTGALAGVGELAIRLRALDAAQVGARLAARGETADVVTSAIRARAPRGSEVSTQRSDTTVTVRVNAPGISLGMLHLPDLRVSVTGPDER
jgi:hypothetical protein